MTFNIWALKSSFSLKAVLKVKEKLKKTNNILTEIQNKLSFHEQEKNSLTNELSSSKQLNIQLNEKIQDKCFDDTENVSDININSIDEIQLSKKTDISDKPKCPDCGSELVYEGGCNICRNCGWSKCG